MKQIFSLLLTTISIISCKEVEKKNVIQVEQEISTDTIIFNPYDTFYLSFDRYNEKLKELGELNQNSLIDTSVWAYRLIKENAFKNSQIISIVKHKDSGIIIRKTNFKLSIFDLFNADSIPNSILLPEQFITNINELSWQRFIKNFATNKCMHKEKDIGGITFDGTKWIIEEFKTGKYRYYFRYSPLKKEDSACINLFLNL